MPHAWMPGARRIRAETDGGSLKGGAPRAVWLTLGTAPCAVSIQSAAQRLVSERRPCHLVWDPITGEIIQLISILRAGRALGAPERLDWGPDRVPAAPDDVNAEGRLCVQIGVLGHPADPFTNGPLTGVTTILNWLDSWNIPRRWPAGQPVAYRAALGRGQDLGQDLGQGLGQSLGLGLGLGRSRAEQNRMLWSRGGHFGGSQVPDCGSIGPGAIDVDRLTGAHVLQVHPRELPLTPLAPAAVPISAYPAAAASRARSSVAARRSLVSGVAP